MVIQVSRRAKCYFIDGGPLDTFVGSIEGEPPPRWLTIGPQVFKASYIVKEELVNCVALTNTRVHEYRLLTRTETGNFIYVYEGETT